MCCILRFHLLSHPQQAKLLLKSVEPFIGFQRFKGFLENWWLSILEVLEVTILIWFSALTGSATTSVLLCHSTHGLIQHPLTLNKSSAGVGGGGGGCGGTSLLTE